MTRRTYWWEDEPDYDPETERERMKRESFQRAMHRLELTYGKYRRRNDERFRCTEVAGQDYEDFGYARTE